jgi:3-isopropylmalate dehydrogenase
MIRFRIVVLPGDGIGPEVVGQALRVLKHATSLVPDAKISIDSFDFGGIAIDNHGVPLPPDTLKACKEAHGILLGQS